ncbi:MAG TPA: pyridoxal phosphate-dependent aminotransferase [Nitrososphaerales archaeon]|nr:pyridoxal phosphate-dependent aminotransferase [Nitrososphaerales archaeon]
MKSRTRKSPAKRSSIKRNAKLPLLATQVQQLATRVANMEKTGEPFGTVTIAEMGQKLASEGKDVIFCAESVISTRVPDVVLDETGKTFRDVAVQQEAPFLGIPELRKAIAARFSRLYGLNLNWENQIIVTSGSMQAEYYLMSALINPGDEVIIPTPTFFFDMPVILARGKPVFAKLSVKNGFFHDRMVFEKLVTRRTKLIAVCNPQNPTGRVLTEEELVGIVELARKHDLTIMHDQVYERIVYDGVPYVPLCKFKEVEDRLVSISSFSKLFNMINYRLGYAVGPKEIINGMELVHMFSSMGIPSLIQRGALAALSPDFEDRHVSETIASLQKARDYAIKRLSGIEGVRVVKPEGTNLILPDISSFGMSSMEFCRYLLKEALVACAPGVAYHAEGHVRISLGTERIFEAIDRIADTIERLNKEKQKPKITA